MGMFDNLECEYPLPAKPSNTWWQTKTFPHPYLEDYRITAEGRLLKRDQWSMKELEAGGDPADNRATWTELNYHGVVNFYTLDDETDEWFECDAKFTDRQLVSVERVEEGKP